MIALAFALLLADQAEMPPAEAPQAVEQTPATEISDEEEICRRVTEPSNTAPGGQKTRKLCKTRDEWRVYVQRRT